jgi:hypothetical protein
LLYRQVNPSSQHGEASGNNEPPHG